MTAHTAIGDRHQKSEHSFPYLIDVLSVTKLAESIQVGGNWETQGHIR